jgi:hypothetical protein
MRGRNPAISAFNGALQRSIRSGVVTKHCKAEWARVVPALANNRSPCPPRVIVPLAEAKIKAVPSMPKTMNSPAWI